MTGNDLVQAFEVERPRLLGLAYRMLGSIADAEDVVQEAWLRWRGLDHAQRDAIDRPAGWLTTVTTRVAIDRTRKVRRRREQYVGPWLPEPIALDDGPEHAAELAESLTLGFLVMLDRLSAVERAVFLLADVFSEPFEAIADAVGKSPDACRQVASRARRKVRSGETSADGRRTSRVPATREVLERAVVAIGSANAAELISLLAPDVTLVSDGGPDRHAARRPVVGAERVARLLINTAAREFGNVTSIDFANVNGAKALLLQTEDGTFLAAQAEIDSDGRICSIRSVVNPNKLQHLSSPQLIV